MANTTKSMAAILFQVSVALAFVLAVCMARNIADNEVLVPRTLADVVKHSKPMFSGILGMSPMPSTEPADPNPNTSGCSKTYKVKKGETCYSTWTKFKVKEKTFYILNPEIDCDNLDIGQALCIAGIAN